MDDSKIELMKKEMLQALNNMTEKDWKEAEKRSETEEYKKEHGELENQCNNIINTMPLNTLEDIQAAKEASRKIPMSAEKVLLFKHLMGIEGKLKNNKSSFI